VATRRRFTQEYRDQAVSLHLDSGRSIVEVARIIGVHETTLGKWVKKAKGSGQVSDKDLSETERAELERLRKDNAVPCRRPLKVTKAHAHGTGMGRGRSHRMSVLSGRP
jgi:transposase